MARKKANNFVILIQFQCVQVRAHAFIVHSCAHNTQTDRQRGRERDTERCREHAHTDSLVRLPNLIKINVFSGTNKTTRARATTHNIRPKKNPHSREEEKKKSKSSRQQSQQKTGRASVTMFDIESVRCSSLRSRNMKK